MDVSGEQQVDVYQDTYRQRLSPLGLPVGPPFKDLHSGSLNPDELGEGCSIWGFLSVSKVQGNMHVALGASSGQNSRHVHQFRLPDFVRFNASHHITYLAFGELYPGVINPLDNVTRIIAKENGGAVHFQYFIKVVPTTYTDVNGKILETNQFSVTEESQMVSASDVLAASQKIPGVFFFYDISPFMVSVTDEKMSFAHFLTNVCAIIGGIFTVAGLIDSTFYHTSKAMNRWKRKVAS